MAYPVKWFHSSFEGAPVLTSAAGAMIGVLDACLLNGFNTKAVSSLTYNSGNNTCTVMISGGHGFQKYQIVSISGANESGFNGEQRVISVTDTTLSYIPATTPGAPTATGTITIKTPPIGGWAKPFSDTNLAAYKSIDVGATGIYLRVDDGSGSYSPTFGCETMTDINTWTGSFNDGWFKKDENSTNTVIPRQWAVVGDSRLFYLITWPMAEVNNIDGSPYVFGDITTYKAGDAYHALLVNGIQTGYGNSQFGQLNVNSKKALARSYTQTPGPVFVYTPGSYASEQLGKAGIPYPNPVDSGLYIHDKIFVSEGSYKQGAIRGELPGLKQIIQELPFPHNTIQDVFPSRPGALMWALRAGTSGGANWIEPLFDLVGPWR
jgi:hypothetical protein